MLVSELTLCSVVFHVHFPICMGLQETTHRACNDGLEIVLIINNFLCRKMSFLWRGFVFAPIGVWGSSDPGGPVLISSQFSVAVNLLLLLLCTTAWMGPGVQLPCLSSARSPKAGCSFQCLTLSVISFRITEYPGEKQTNSCGTSFTSGEVSTS